MTEDNATPAEPEDPPRETTGEHAPGPAQWYYLKSGQPHGPVSESSIRAWLESEFLRPTDFLWRSGLPEWQPAHQFPELGGTEGDGTPPPVRPGQPLGPSPAAGQLGATGVRAAYANFFLRAGAALIDWMLISLVMFFIFRPEIPEVTSFEEMRAAVEAMQANHLMIAFSFVVPWLYFAALESSPWQATLGKKAFRLRVVSVTGGRLGPIRATFRHLAKILLMDLTFFLSFLIAVFTARRQALHDLAAGTLVVRD